MNSGIKGQKIICQFGLKPLVLLKKENSSGKLKKDIQQVIKESNKQKVFQNS